MSGWTAPAIVASAAAGAAMLAGWLVWELRQRAPLIDIRLILTRRAWPAFLAYALLGIGPFQYGLIVYAMLQEPIWTGAGYGMSATMAGLANLPSAFAGAFGGPWSGRLAQRIGRFVNLAVAMLIYTLGWTPIAFMHGFAVMLLAIAVIGLGSTMVFSAIANVLVAATPEDRTSEILGVAEVARATAMAIGSQLMVLLLASSVAHRPGEGVFPSMTAHALTLRVTLALCVAALLLAAVTPGDRRGPAATT